MKKINETKTEEEVLKYFEYHYNKLLEGQTNQMRNLLMEFNNDVDRLKDKCGYQMEKIKSSSIKNTNNGVEE